MTDLKPNFLLVGAAKAGTTSLHDYLGQHPDIFMSRSKEPFFFTRDWGPKNLKEYLELFADAIGKKAIGESSTGYLYSEESPKWIKSVLGNVRIIILLRNPAERAFSLYSWMVREGFEDAQSFAEALKREILRQSDASFRRTCPQFYPDYLYFTTGLYTEQVRRYLDIFGTTNVRIHLFEDLVSDPLCVCRDIFTFLEVNGDFTPRINIQNRGRVPVSISLQYWLREKSSRKIGFLPQRLRDKLIRELKALNVRHGREPKLDKHIEAALMHRYRENILQLQTLLDRNLALWFEGS
jgi:Sulfotransferase domain